MPFQSRPSRPPPPSVRRANEGAWYAVRVAVWLTGVYGLVLLCLPLAAGTLRHAGGGAAWERARLAHPEHTLAESGVRDGTVLTVCPALPVRQAPATTRTSSKLRRNFVETSSNGIQGRVILLDENETEEIPEPGR